MKVPEPPDEVLTVPEVANDLKCSKSLVYKIIRGEIEYADSLPAIYIGRRRLVLRSTLEMWKKANEYDRGHG